MTQLEQAKKNKISPAASLVAKRESLKADFVRQGIANGTIVIPLNKNRKLKRPCGIGRGLTTKVNANIGTSTDKPDLPSEINKLKAAVSAGADAVMDLSVGGDLERVLKNLIAVSTVPLGTVPIYQAAVYAQKQKGSFLNMSAKDLLQVIEIQAKLGVDFFTIHCGVTYDCIDLMKKSPRILDVVSRGGAILINWMKTNHQENPLYKYFDKVLDIAHEYDVTLSLGDGLRPGSVLDATDKLQLKELSLLGKLAKRARRSGVQVMIEGPGHVPINQIAKNVMLEKKLCNQAPFYVLGPLVTDIASGYDHISSAIGGALAASLGADFLCYVTPSEHLRHPDIHDVKEGVIAARIAAHAADIAKGIKSAREWDRQMSLARKKRDWKRQIKLSIDPDKAKKYRESSQPKQRDVCTMCGEYCSIKLIEECMG
ncbi:MAG: phosphomethylpyrimidine synthase ThiC [Candidatus Omnitrophota bacterium]|nr:phosphomethylpyrimidine synthase ThiC [Candidatus Omnitrophota bacterium]